MKNLLIMRHAKSAYPPDVADDFDRPLSKRGRKDAPQMARALRACKAIPERIASSPAVRARETAEAVSSALGLSDDVLVLDERLYLATPGSMIQVAEELPDTFARALIIAHNPGLEQWLVRLCGCSARLPTAGLAAVDMPIARWSDIERVRGQLQWLIFPRFVKALS
jgi:phosphohistidine phosphatase